MAAKLASDGPVIVGSTLEELAAHVQEEVGRWRRIASEAKINLKEQ